MHNKITRADNHDIKKVLIRQTVYCVSSFLVVLADIFLEVVHEFCFLHHLFINEQFLDVSFDVIYKVQHDTVLVN